MAFWSGMHDMSAELVESNKELIAKAEAEIAEVAPQVQAAAERRDIAKARNEKIKRGETVTGGLGKRIDFETVLKEAGLTTRVFGRARKMERLTDARCRLNIAPYYEQWKTKTIPFDSPVAAR
jgi:hypothetical protein